MLDNSNTGLQTILGEVIKITYRNEINCYTVAVVRAGKDEITVVGTMPFLNEGDSAEFTGTYSFHQTYGEQFKVDSFEKKAPKSSASILRYLSSGSIKGIGPSTAQKIVDKFGEDTLNIIQNNPDDLSLIKGISLKKAREISEEYNKQYGVRDIIIMLSKYGVSPEKCIDVYKKLGSKSIEIIKNNPYSLCEDEIDISFEIAEDIADDLLFSHDSEMRVSAGLEYVLRKNLANGHTCLPKNKLFETSCRLLECNEVIIESCCQRLVDCLRLRLSEFSGIEYVSIPDYFSAEEHIAARLKSVKNYINRHVTVDELEIKSVENSLNIEFEDLQRKAVFEAFESGILILTGGPGTGKTTTLNAIIKLFENRSLDIELVAPTGRAAKRMTELTGRNAKTIHRLLEVEWSKDDKQQFVRNERNPLSCDVIIVDEASMIDALLFDSLLKALRLSCRIILVGDSDQLPSIGAGNVLNDILSSQLFPSIRLKKVFRQASQSLIVTNAHSIINGETPDFSKKDSDCFFIRKNDKNEVSKTVLELVKTRIPVAYKFDSVKDIQVLCPSRMYDSGTVNLNCILQENLNSHISGEPQISFKGQFLRIKDKVMQIKNNYDLQFLKDNGEYGSGVFNGDVGFITDIDPRGGIVKVRYDDRIVTYYSEDLNQLELAYAVTVHKSQGSEYDCVILPLFDVPKKLKYRNLLYTAVTRAKKLLIIVGSEIIWNEMASNNRKTLRYTLLQDLLTDS